MQIYNTGPGGTSTYVKNGALLITACPSGQLFPYMYGPGGQCINVDSLGRLVVSLDGWTHVDRIEDDLSLQINGIKNEFIFQCNLIIEPLQIYRNGILCKKGVENDYIVSSSGTLLTNFVPRLGGSLMAIYYKECELCH